MLFLFWPSPYLPFISKIPQLLTKTYTFNKITSQSHAKRKVFALLGSVLNATSNPILPYAFSYNSTLLLSTIKG